ncbi:response regulator [Sphingomonas xanthus]|uniref:Response regulator n=1 Tax=Sphingomonas xanthus TaxID=2594473 RepID=A0A516IRB1_9SPHN|nr:response regulator [Sphingomonas xanthus]QDP19441.1 response regulator [Sphingomonas xanthus]
MAIDPAPLSNCGTGPARLLLVEPNRSALHVLAKRLGEAGYRIIACDDAANAMAEMLRLPIDAVVAELRMASMSGVELTRRIRDDTLLSDTPVVLITGKSDSAGAVDGFAAGADDVVAKPFHCDVLAARIARRINRARSVKQLRADNAMLDARIVTRAIQLGEIREALVQSEAERERLIRLVARA